MAISFVASADFAANGSSTAAVQTTIPSSIQAGDLLIAAYGNVGNPYNDGPGNTTELNGWSIVDEVTDASNAYFLVMGKVADSGDVGDAGSVVSIATLSGTNGSTFRVCPCAAYRGVESTTWFEDTNLNHVPLPGGTKTVTSGSASNTETDNWYVCAFGAATGGGGGPGSLTSTADGDRGESSTGTSGLIATVGFFDSAGTIAAGSQSESGTVNYTPSRLNGWIGILNAEDIAAIVYNDADTLGLADQVTTDLNDATVYTYNASDTLGLLDGAIPQNASDRFTNRLNIYKVNAGEEISVEQDLNENWDLVDAAFGFVECTSDARPEFSFAGLCIFESDTSKVYVSQGTTPIEDSWIEILNGSSSTGAEGLNLVGPSTTSDTVIVGTIADEEYDRFIVDADGTLNWGNGSSEVDTALSRSGAGVLSTASEFAADSFNGVSLAATGTLDEDTLETSTAVSVGLSEEVDPTFYVDSVGTVFWGEGTSPVDVHMRRDVDSGLATISGDLVINGELTTDGIGQSRFVQKTAHTDRSNDTDVTDDPELQISVDANGTYEVEMWLVFSANGDCDINTNWSAPASADGFKSVLGSTSEDSTSTSRSDTNVRLGIHFFNTACQYEVDTSGDGQWGYQRGILVMGDTAGTLTFQWGQITSSSNVLTLEQFSYIKITRVA